ncbi:MAG: tetratricopeptide repeat protein [Gammaproteobacteria bacterium]
MSPDGAPEPWRSAELLRLLEAGDAAGAAVLAASRCAREPDDAEAWFLLGSARHREGRLDEARAAFARAGELAPDDARVLAARAALDGTAGDHAGALALSLRAIEIAPGQLRHRVNAAVALEALGRDDEARRQYDIVLERFPGMGDARRNRAALALRQGDLATAAADAAVLVQQFPGLPDPLVLRGATALAGGDWRAALTDYEAALALEPHLDPAALGRAVALAAGGELAAADEALAAAGASGHYDGGIDPRRIYLGAAWERHRRGDWTGHAGFVATFARVLAAGDGPPAALAEPMLLWAACCLPLPAVARAALTAAVAATVEKPAARRCHKAEAAPEPGSRSRPRLGYLGYEPALAPLLAHHDRGRFAIHVFTLHGNEVPALPAGSGDAVHALAGLDDATAAARIAAAGVDILVDTRGYLPHGRPGILAHHAAPLQVGYGGFPGSLGARLLDYRVSDGVASPVTDDAEFSESLLRLPHAHLVCDSELRSTAAEVTRTMVGLPDDAPVLACHNALAQIEPAVFAAWMTILRRVPGALLWLREGAPGAAVRLRGAAAAAGVASSRLVFSPAGRRAPAALADLYLDTWEVAGQHTVAAALVSGLPVIARRGDRFASRVGAALVCSAGLPECVASDAADYIERACALLADRSGLGSLRLRLANRAAPLFDTAARVRDYERGLSAAWARHVAGAAPAAIDVPDGP